MANAKTIIPAVVASSVMFRHPLSGAIMTMDAVGFSLSEGKEGAINVAPVVPVFGVIDNGALLYGNKYISIADGAVHDTVSTIISPEFAQTATGTQAAPAAPVGTDTGGSPEAAGVTLSPDTVIASYDGFAGFSSRTKNALNGAGIVTLRDASLRTKQQLNDVKGVARDAVRDIENALGQAGLQWGMTAADAGIADGGPSSAGAPAPEQSVGTALGGLF